MPQLSGLVDFTQTQNPDVELIGTNIFSSCLPKQGETTQDQIFPWLDSRDKISVTKACKSGVVFLCDCGCRQQKHMIQQARQTHVSLCLERIHSSSPWRQSLFGDEHRCLVAHLIEKGTE